MNTKIMYTKPEIEIIEVELEGTMALSGGSEDLSGSEDYPGSANSKRRGFWNNEE